MSTERGCGFCLTKACVHSTGYSLYYLFDEVRYNGKDNTVDQRRYAFDEFACKNSQTIFTMTQKLADSRKEYNENIVVLGNGALRPENQAKPSYKFQHSAAFIGNFRDWIDEELLTALISSRPEILFAIAGPVEANMKGYLDNLLNMYPNTVYYGCVKKEKMTGLYRMFDCVIIPYKQNEFIQATRPIKIVESILAGTPVITIPMNGYEESEFVRFAENAEQFADAIKACIDKPIDQSSESYAVFSDKNTWDRKAEILISQFPHYNEVHNEC